MPANMFPTTYFIAVGLLTGVCIGQKPTLTPPTTEVEKYINQSYIVTCGTPYATNLAWLGPKDQLIKTGKTVHTEERGESYLSLVFESISGNDRGKYTCRASLAGETHLLYFHLIVVKPITFGGLLATQKEIVQNATESKATTVKCEVTGDPTPKVVWQFKGKALSQDDRFLPMVHGLYIKNVSYQDEGTYQCRAFQVTTRSSGMESREIKLVVQHKPRWVDDINRTTQDKAYGYANGMTNITCQASARPPAQYKWTALNGTLDSNMTNIVDLGDRSILQVRMSDSAVMGFYECTANNSLGEIKKVIELLEGSKPSPPIRVSVVGVGVTTAQFHLHAVSKEQIIGYRIQFIKRSMRDSIDKGDYQDVYTKDGVPYSIRQLEDNTEYCYRVATRNNAGLSDYSPIQTFTTKDKYTSDAWNRMPSFALVCLSLFVKRTL